MTHKRGCAVVYRCLKTTPHPLDGILVSILHWRTEGNGLKSAQLVWTDTGVRKRSWSTSHSQFWISRSSVCRWPTDVLYHNKSFQLLYMDQRLF